MEKIKINRKNNHGERGAALVTVLMISVILSIACIAMLKAVGANSRNSTDVLSETKAYYAAESGLQATINVLRNTDITYSQADQSGTLEDANWLVYDYVNGTDKRVIIGETVDTYTPSKGIAYKVFVTDPDDTSDSLTFNTSGAFVSYIATAGTVGTIFPSGKKICITLTATPCPEDNPPSPSTIITFIDAPSTVHDFTTNPSLGSFSITQVGGGVNIGETKFQIDYRLTDPRAATMSIVGYINKLPLATGADQKNAYVTFVSQEYKLMGSKIELCKPQTSPNTGEDRCPTVNFNLTTVAPSATLRADITPLEPYRLRVKSTGYGPNGAKKELEGIIQKNFFNGLGSGAATTMLGTSVTPPGGLPFLFSAGSSNGVTYCGGVIVKEGNKDVCTCPETMTCVPSFGLTDTANLDYVADHPPQGDSNQMFPSPLLLSNNTPDWQQTPEALNALIDQLRTTAKNSNRYFLNPTGNQENYTVGSNQKPPGSFDSGIGITFCEGSCKIGSSGGGILVVTGKLTNIGGFNFKGMIIVTGEEGWSRNGAGQGQVIGNVIIAPYNKRTYYPENLSTTFLAPRYEIVGGGGSDVIYDDVSATFDNISSVSDFMLGIAEK